MIYEMLCCREELDIVVCCTESQKFQSPDTIFGLIISMGCIDMEKANHTLDDYNNCFWTLMLYQAP